jgi:hypothetical protein
MLGTVCESFVACQYAFCNRKFCKRQFPDVFLPTGTACPFFSHPSGSDASAVTFRKQSTPRISLPVTHDDHRFLTCKTLCNRHLASISLHTVAHVPLAPSGIKDWNHRSVILTDNSGIKALAYVLGRDKYIRWWLFRNYDGFGM